MNKNEIHEEFFLEDVVGSCENLLYMLIAVRQIYKIREREREKEKCSLIRCHVLLLLKSICLSLFGPFSLSVSL